MSTQLEDVVVVGPQTRIPISLFVTFPAAAWPIVAMLAQNGIRGGAIANSLDGTLQRNEHIAPTGCLGEADAFACFPSSFGEVQAYSAC